MIKHCGIFPEVARRTVLITSVCKARSSLDSQALPRTMDIMSKVTSICPCRIIASQTRIKFYRSSVPWPEVKGCRDDSGSTVRCNGKLSWANRTHDRGAPKPPLRVTEGLIFRRHSKFDFRGGSVRRPLKESMESTVCF